MDISRDDIYIYMYTRKFLTFHNFFLYITNISIFPRVQFRPLPLGERNSTFHLSLTGAIIFRSNFTPLHISIGRFLFIKLDVGRNRPLPPTEWNRRRMGGGGFDQVLETRNPLITRSSATSWKGFSVEKKVAISCPRARQHRTLRGSNKSRFSTGGGPLLLLLLLHPCFRKRFEVSITFSRVVLSKSYTANRISRSERMNFALNVDVSGTWNAKRAKK